MRKILPFAMVVIALSAAPAWAQSVTVVTPGEMQWADAPQFGKGVKLAVLMGDPGRAGPYVVRLKVPAHTTFPAHTHPDTENVTILSGALLVGLGNAVDKSKGQRLGSGAFVSLPQNTPHFAWTEKRETIVQIHGVGPSGMTVATAALKQ
jgi:quercetin dioxygenase-like cupin family protein